MATNQERPITPVVYQCKYYDTKEKAYADCFVISLQKAMEIAAQKFDEGSKYFNISIIDIQ